MNTLFRIITKEKEGYTIEIIYASKRFDPVINGYSPSEVKITFAHLLSPNCYIWYERILYRVFKHFPS